MYQLLDVIVQSRLASMVAPESIVSAQAALQHASSAEAGSPVMSGSPSPPRDGAAIPVDPEEVQELAQRLARGEDIDLNKVSAATNAAAKAAMDTNFNRSVTLSRILT